MYAEEQYAYLWIQTDHLEHQCVTKLVLILLYNLISVHLKKFLMFLSFKNCQHHDGNFFMLLLRLVKSYAYKSFFFD